MNTMQKIVRKISRVFDPVVQHHGAIMFGDYKGHSVLLRPVLFPGDSTTIGEWVPDPIELEAIELEEIERTEGRQK